MYTTKRILSCDKEKWHKSERQSSNGINEITFKLKSFPAFFLQNPCKNKKIFCFYIRIIPIRQKYDISQILCYTTYA